MRTFTNSFRSLTLALLGLALPALPSAAQTPAVQPDWSALNRPRTHKPAPTRPAITPADLKTRLYIFADDSMMGRVLADPGNVKAVEYIAAEVKRLGLKPMGDNGTYFQNVGVVERSYDSTSRFTVGSTVFTPWTDFILRDQGANVRSLVNAQAIYGGTWGDSATLIDPAATVGKVVVFNVNPSAYMFAPGSVSRATANAKYPDAAGLVFASLEAMPPQAVALYQQPDQFLQSDTPSPVLPSFLYVTKRVASVLLGANPDSAKRGAAGARVTSTPRFHQQGTKYPTRNVVAMIEGSDPKLRAEFVAIGAHNDHIGYSDRPVAHDSIYVVNHLYRQQGADDRAPQLTPERIALVNSYLAEIRKSNGGSSARPDSIYNGADDDGSGSVSVLEIAQYFAAKRVKPKRSLLFVWHVGEEEGLYGSQWITDHPPVPRDSIVAQLNIDMIGRGGPDDVTGTTKEGADIHGNADYVQLVGSRRLSTELGDLAEMVNKTETRPLAFDYNIDANGHPQRIYCRSDHYEYARYGIPIIFFTTGGHADYHQVTDEPQYVDYDRMSRVAQLVADLATKVGNLSHRPVVDKAKPDPQGRCVQ